MSDKTDDLINHFAAALREKLTKAEEKYGYDDAWLNGGWRDDLIRKLHEHIAKGDPRDVAAYCAFAWHHQWSLAPSPGDAREVADAIVSWVLGPTEPGADELLAYISSVILAREQAAVARERAEQDDIIHALRTEVARLQNAKRKEANAASGSTADPSPIFRVGEPGAHRDDGLSVTQIAGTVTNLSDAVETAAQAWVDRAVAVHAGKRPCDVSDYRDAFLFALDQIAAAIEARGQPAASAPTVPRGCVVVPVEPTEAMLDAGEAIQSVRGTIRDLHSAIYRAMLTAAPRGGGET